MSERIAGLMRTGERPGEVILGERETVLPWFGPMLETTFGPIFEKQIFPAIPFFREIDRNDALAIDLGCGNGWYLRALAKHSPKLSG
ncbi:Methyltransferase type 11, partial [mine drainage metagenome]